MYRSGYIVSLSLLAATCMGCRAGAAPAPSPVAANDTWQTDVNDPTDDDRGFLGIVVAPETVDVTTQLEARVTDIPVRAGDHVARGAILAKLDTRTARHELEAARADLLSAKSELERAHLEVAQAKERLERRETTVVLPRGPVGTSSGEEISTSRYQAKIAVAHVNAAEANVAVKAARLHEFDALYHEGVVRAPFDGAIVARYADVGTLIHKGAAIVRLLGTGEPRVRFAVPEDRGDAVAVADPIRIVLGDVTITGRVERVSAEIDAASRMIFAEGSLDITSVAAGSIRVGQVARVFAAKSSLHASR